MVAAGATTLTALHTAPQKPIGDVTDMTSSLYTPSILVTVRILEEKQSSPTDAELTSTIHHGTIGTISWLSAVVRQQADSPGISPAHNTP